MSWQDDEDRKTHESGESTSTVMIDAVGHDGGDVSDKTHTVKPTQPMSRSYSPVRRLSKYWLGIVVVLELLVLFVAAEFLASFFLPPAQHYIHPQMLMEPDVSRVYFHRPNQRAFTIDKPLVRRVDLSNSYVSVTFTSYRHTISIPTYSACLARR